MIQPFVLFLTFFAAPGFTFYTPDDEIKVLDIDNFKSSIENSTAAWLVEFYLSWCGGCQKFAPKWKEFAKEVAPWRNLITVAALDCADTKNMPLCSEFGIGKYPLVKYFHENYQTGDGVSNVYVGKAQDSIKKEVIKKIVEEVSEGRGRMYPNLLPYDGTSIDQLLNGIGKNAQYIILIVEAAESYLGVEVALDLHKISGVVVRRVLENNTQLIEELNIDHIPSLIIFDGNRTDYFTEPIEDKQHMRKMINFFLTTKPLDKSSNDTNVDPDYTDNKKILREHVKKMGDVIFQKDLEAALRYSLLQEVASIKIIKNEQLQTLKSYLNIIKEQFPFGYNKTSLITQLTELTSGTEEIEGTTIRKLITQEDRDTFSSNMTFLGCLGSSPKYRGYSCSLWQLFHYFTINANNTILDVICDYVKHFFSCQQCSEHFLAMAEERNMKDVPSRYEGILWLWRAHNVVNERLKGDVTEDPEYPKRQFPVKERCPECYYDDGSWNEEEVFKYLKMVYGRYNIRYIGSDTRVLFPGLD